MEGFGTVLEPWKSAGSKCYSHKCQETGESCGDAEIYATYIITPLMMQPSRLAKDCQPSQASGHGPAPSCQWVPSTCCER
jgi:hypothetical protein